MPFTNEFNLCASWPSWPFQGLECQIFSLSMALKTKKSRAENQKGLANSPHYGKNYKIPLAET